VIIIIFSGKTRNFDTSGVPGLREISDFKLLLQNNLQAPYHSSSSTVVTFLKKKDKPVRKLS